MVIRPIKIIIEFRAYKNIKKKNNNNSKQKTDNQQSTY